MMNKCRVLLVEDHKILREGLRALLAHETSFEVVAEAADGREALHVAIAEQPDAVVMDLSLPSVNGTEAIANIKRRLPNTRIVVLTAHRADEYVHAALRAGADAYVLKDDSHTELLMALRAIRSGKTYLSPGVCGAVVNNYLTGGRGPANSAFERLTHREREVIKLIAEGKRNKEIASVMCLSPKTVEKHRANLMRKLSLRSATALTAYAFENGLVIR